MKVKCIKDTIGFKEWDVWEAEWDYLVKGYKRSYTDWSLYPEYFQEVVEEEVKKPRWKVGDKVVVPLNYRWEVNVYTNIHCIGISKKDWSFEYNNLPEEDFRSPTPEELELYFVKK